MVMRPFARARLVAGAFLLAAIAGGTALAEQVQIAGERSDQSCPSGKTPVGIVRMSPAESVRDMSGCIVLFAVTDLSDSALPDAASALARQTGARGVVLDFGNGLSTASEGWETRLSYVVKTLSSAVRSASATALVAVELPSGESRESAFTAIVTSEELQPYIDAFVVRPGQPAPPEIPQRVWILTTSPASGSVVDSVIGALAEFPQAALAGVLAETRPLTEDDWTALGRLQAYLTADVSRDPTATHLTRKDGSTADVLRFFNAKAFTPILLLREDASGEARIEPPGGPFDRASVENLGSGARRDFDLRGARALTLDLSRGPLVVVLQPAARKQGETKAAVEVGAIRGLTAEEIIARERAWDAGQREKVSNYVASMDTSLRFRVAEFAGSLDLTIRGPFFYERGRPGDWAWHEFFLNGVKWKGRTIPKLPILQPEKVTTLPLDIRLTEEYAYELAGETTIDGRPAYRVDFRPRATVGAKPIYRGTAWIDKETFALLRRESIQLNLKGDTLSNVQTEYYRAVPESPDVVLPLEIRGQQVFSTAGRTTAIERRVVMSDVVVNAPDFAARRLEAYASRSQMVRDTDEGLRYLVPDPKAPETRIVENRLTRKSLFGLGGVFYQTGQDYPFPLLGVQYFNFDLWGKNKQLSVFFAGALLFANYTDPSLLGSHFDLGADLFGVAIPFSETNYRDGEEVKSEKIKHLPEFLQVNVGHPFGPYLKISLGVFTAWDDYQRHSDTGPNFVTPVDTFTNGAELRLNWNEAGYNAAGKVSYHSRRKWEPWGDPATSGYDPRQKDYWKYSLELTKGFYFPGFRKLLAKVSYLDGSDLDRFSQWDFGPLGGNPIRGFPGGSVRADRAVLANLSYGLNIENVVRFEVFYDQALVTNKLSGYDKTYFSGAGISTAFNGPWDNTRIRGEVGIPVVRHGVSGFTISAQLLKLF
ncbi:MAG TPA: hypothetical protein VGL03_04970 [Thermoanaerobaculia bacterium]